MDDMIPLPLPCRFSSGARVRMLGTRIHCPGTVLETALGKRRVCWDRTGLSTWVTLGQITELSPEYDKRVLKQRIAQ